MAKTATAKQKVEPLITAEVQALEYVDDDKTYYVTIQLGEARRWRQFAGGRWVVNDKAQLANATDKAYIHEPAIYERVGPFSGQMVNGLVGLHNKWRTKNANREPGGEVQHQMLLLSTEATDDEALDNSRKAFRFERMIRNIVRETVVAVMEELTKK